MAMRHWGGACIVFLGVVIATAIFAPLEGWTHSGPADSLQFYYDNAAGVPAEAVCNGTFPIDTRTRAPYQPVFNRRAPLVTTNVSICPLYGTALQMQLYINLTGFLNPVPDNYTAAGILSCSALIQQVLPGSLIVFANSSSSFAGPQNGVTITITNNLMTNNTVIDAIRVFNAVQYCSYFVYGNEPVSLLSWNESASVNVPFTAYPPVCSLLNFGNATCPSDRICANWLGNAMCVCNPPNWIWMPGVAFCVPNPCYRTPLGAANPNGGCGQNLQCRVNFNAANNVTCG